MSAFSHCFEKFCYCLSRHNGTIQQQIHVCLGGLGWRTFEDLFIRFIRSRTACHRSVFLFALLMFLDVHYKADKDECDCLIRCFDLK